MKYKRLFIMLSCCIGFLLLCTVLSFTLFRVHKVELHFKNETLNLSSEEEHEYIIKSSKVSYSTPVFAINKRNLIENMELSNPYLKVINIETVFPNKLVVHCAEREVTFAIEIDNNTYFIVDSDLKILETYQTYDKAYESTQTNAILLRGIHVENKSAKMGEALICTENFNVAKLISDTLLSYNRPIAEQRAMFKEIRVGYERSRYTLQSEMKLTFVTFDNFEINVYDIESLFTKKMGYILALIPKYYDKANDYTMHFNINPKDQSDIFLQLKSIKN